MKTVLVTGGFDPLHSGHIEYFKAAREHGTILFVGVNSDEWLTRKKGQPFMSISERMAIIQELSCVGHVFQFDDSDGSAIKAIEYVKDYIPNNTPIVFANGGDRTKDNIPEMIFDDVEFIFGVGGKNKKNSSSWILDEWKTQKTLRDWGYWRILDDKQPRVGQKVKELVINPGCSLSDQRHVYRKEFWYLLEGSINIELEWSDGRRLSQQLTEHTTFVIPNDVWHKTTNIGIKPAHVVEIQYGDKCIEEDIERRNG